jgi:hypothetical protein
MAADLTASPKAYAPARFRALLALLVVAGVVAVAAAAVLLGSGSSTASAPNSEWASWYPTEAGTNGLTQIANHVGPEYRNVGGNQIVSVTGGPLEVANLPAHIAIRNAKGDGSVQMVSGNGALFTLCGLGPNCSIATGRPSVERMMLLRREALELALRSFRNDSSLENVAVLMPPRPGTRSVKLNSGKTVETGNQGTAILLQRSQLENQLDKHLDETLPDSVPTVATIAIAPETQTVNQLTAPGMFMASIIQAQDASAYLVLDPLT